MADIQGERTAVERLKLSMIWELTNVLVEERESVAIFFTFLASMNGTKNRYGARAVYVHGSQKIEDRERAMALFQAV
jgi:hypothetical protein